ncbi:hypothetical protein T459_22101 [Capsicum annuum]|uniref:Uncharacterized protein n=1 Tax=Capsicum annuum TaxID=4072 RepID=A0A2G2YYK7_CAPAN|nr:hypothetical protein T459_22101 [Capsicum annuum]
MARAPSIRFSSIDEALSLSSRARCNIFFPSREPWERLAPRGAKLIFLSGMIHKKSGRIRTYSRPAPDLLGWVAGLAPLVASVPETDVLRYPAPNLVSPTLLLVVPLPITVDAGAVLNMSFLLPQTAFEVPIDYREIDREVGSQACSKFLQDVAKPSEGYPSVSKTDYPTMPVVDNLYTDEKPEAWITDLNFSMRSAVDLYDWRGNPPLILLPFSAFLVGLTLAIDSILSVVRHYFAVFPVCLCMRTDRSVDGLSGAGIVFSKEATGLEGYEPPISLFFIYLWVKAGRNHRFKALVESRSLSSRFMGTASVFCGCSSEVALPTSRASTKAGKILIYYCGFSNRRGIESLDTGALSYLGLVKGQSHSAVT